MSNNNNGPNKKPHGQYGKQKKTNHADGKDKNPGGFMGKKHSQNHSITQKMENKQNEPVRKKESKQPESERKIDKMIYCTINRSNIGLAPVEEKKESLTEQDTDLQKTAAVDEVVDDESNETLKTETKLNSSLVAERKDQDTAAIVDDKKDQDTTLIVDDKKDQDTAVIVDDKKDQNTAVIIDEKKQIDTKPAESNPDSKKKTLPKSVTTSNKSAVFKKLMAAVLEYEEILLENKRLKEKIKEQEVYCSKLLEQKTQLLSQLDESRKECEERIIQIAGLNQEIEQRDEVIDIVKADKTESAHEFETDLAASLRPFYIDYMELKDMDMSEDVGAAISETMENVFKVLEKKGIIIQ